MISSGALIGSTPTQASGSALREVEQLARYQD